MGLILALHPHTSWGDKLYNILVMHRKYYSNTHAIIKMENKYSKFTAQNIS